MAQGKIRVALGMSGGVDSAVSAAVLMRAGYEVVGVTCVFVQGESSLRSVADARACCDRMGLRHVVRDCTEHFDSCVVRPFVEAYAAGATPSPCVGCNARCKVPELLAAADELGCQKVATGHYARIVQMQDSGRYAVKSALDARKDQSYMLSRLPQDQLSRLLTPLGGTTKTSVRIEAEDLELPVADKPESQDVCFIQGDYRPFLAAHGVKQEPGDIVDVAGSVVGRHDGLAGFTLGQRHGIGVAAARPYYVVGKDAGRNRLIVGFEEDAFIDRVQVEGIEWQAIERLDQLLECCVKLRYRSQPTGCRIVPLDDGGISVQVDLAEPQKFTAPGQIAVFSQGDTVLGGGTIVGIERRTEGDGRP